MSTVGPEPVSFELDRFELIDEDRLEVSGRWYGVRGRRFVRPSLTVAGAEGRSRAFAERDAAAMEREPSGDEPDAAPSPYRRSSAGWVSRLVALLALLAIVLALLIILH